MGGRGSGRVADHWMNRSVGSGFCCMVPTTMMILLFMLLLLV